jgi:hypothetical protein
MSLKPETHRFLFLIAATSGVASREATAGPKWPPETTEDLRQLTSPELEEVDLIRMGLIVAKEVDETIDIEMYVQLIDAIAKYIEETIKLNEPVLRADLEYYGSMERAKCAVIWTVFRDDFSWQYLDGKRKVVDNTNLKEKFVHGLLSNRQ